MCPTILKEVGLEQSNNISPTPLNRLLQTIYSMIGPMYACVLCKICNPPVIVTFLFSVSHGSGIFTKSFDSDRSSCFFLLSGRRNTRRLTKPRLLPSISAPIESCNSIGTSNIVGTPVFWRVAWILCLVLHVPWNMITIADDHLCWNRKRRRGIYIFLEN